MGNIRASSITRFLTLVTGLVFLNLSFSLSEVALLKIESSQSLENIVKMISNISEEEEGDAHSNAGSHVVQHHNDCCVPSRSDSHFATNHDYDNAKHRQDHMLLSIDAPDIATPPPKV